MKYGPVFSGVVSHPLLVFILNWPQQRKAKIMTANAAYNKRFGCSLFFLSAPEAKRIEDIQEVVFVILNYVF